MGTGPDDLFALAEEYLDLCVVALEAAQGAPPRRYVSPGPPAWDCELVAVHVGGPVVAPTSSGPGALAEGHRLQATGQVNIIDLVATILRCVPVMKADGSAPVASSVTDASRVTLSDLWTIWNHIAHGRREGTLFDGKCRDVTMDPAVTLAPAGGFAGWQVSVRVQLDGYRLPA